MERNPRGGTKSNYEEAIKSGVMERLLKLCPAKPIAKPATESQGRFWQHRSMVRREQNKILCLPNGLAKLLVKLLELLNS